jgi:hypothetical protein
MTAEAADSSCNLQVPPIFPMSGREARKLKEEAGRNLKVLFRELVSHDDETLDLTHGDCDDDAKKAAAKKNFPAIRHVPV